METCGVVAKQGIGKHMQAVNPVTKDVEQAGNVCDGARTSPSPKNKMR